MAITKSPAMSMDASGNVGGLSFTKWRGKSVVRGVWTGTYPDTPLQQASNARVTTVSQAWGGTLSALQRASWDNFAKSQRFTDRLGTKWVPTGYNLFMKRNLVRQVMGLGILSVPGTETTNPVVLQFRLSNAILHRHVDVFFLRSLAGGSDLFVEADKYQIMRAGPFTSGGRHALAGEYRQLVIADQGEAYHDTDLPSDGFYWYKCRAMLNGGIVGNYVEGQLFVEQDPGIMVDMINWIIWDVGTGDPNVPNWLDQSGNGNDYSAVGLGIPTKTGTGVLFDGVNDHMGNDIILITDDMWQRIQDWTIICVFTPIAIANNPVIIALGQTVDNSSIGQIKIDFQLLLDAQVKDRYSITVRDSTHMVLDVWTSDNTVEVDIGALQIWTITQDGAQIRIYKNDSPDVAVHKVIKDISGPLFFNEETIIAAREGAGGHSNFYEGEIQEKLLWDRLLTETERQAVIAELMEEYGI